MRYAKPVVLGFALTIAAALFAARGKAEAPPATQPRVTKIEPPAELVREQVDPTASSTIPEKNQSRDKVIAFSPPKEYMDWFHKKTGCCGANKIRVEALPYQDELHVSLCSTSSFHEINAEGTITGGWDVRVLVSGQSLVPGNKRHLAGQIEVLVRPDRRVIFPFDAEIALSDDKNCWDSLDPKGASISWSLPEIWKKDEN